MNPGVVEEIEVIFLDRIAGRMVGIVVSFDFARRKRLPGQAIIHRHGDPIALSRFQQIRNLGSQGKEAAPVRRAEAAVDVDMRVMRDAAQAQDDAAPHPRGGDKSIALVPDQPEVGAQFVVGRDVVVAGGHRHFEGVRQGLKEPLLVQAFVVDIAFETPETAEVF